MDTMAFIYQPHFKTNCFRVATANQRGKEYNYIVVMCSPEFNGIYSWPAKNKNKYKLWLNGKKLCYQVPIEDCKKTQELEDIKSPAIRDIIRNFQNKWYNNTIRGRDYTYKNKPEWILKEESNERNFR